MQYGCNSKYSVIGRQQLAIYSEQIIPLRSFCFPFRLNIAALNRLSIYDYGVSLDLGWKEV